MGSGVGNRVFGTEKIFSRVRVKVLGGFELNDKNNFEKNILTCDLIWWIFQDVTVFSVLFSFIICSLLNDTLQY